MQKLLLLIWLFTGMNATAQTAADTTIEMKVVCGYAGITSTELHTVRRLVAAKDYAALSRKLNSTNATEALLSAIALKELQFRNVRTISDEEETVIRSLENSQKNYRLCYTCVEHFSGTVAQLLSIRNARPYAIIREAIFNK